MTELGERPHRSSWLERPTLQRCQGRHSDMLSFVAKVLEGQPHASPGVPSVRALLPHLSQHPGQREALLERGLVNEAYAAWRVWGDVFQMEGLRRPQAGGDTAPPLDTRATRERRPEATGHLNVTLCRMRAGGGFEPGAAGGH